MDVAIVASGHQHQVYLRWIMGVLAIVGRR